LITHAHMFALGLDERLLSVDVGACTI